MQAICRTLFSLNKIMLWAAMFLSSCYSSFLVNNFKQYSGMHKYSGMYKYSDMYKYNDQLFTFGGSCSLLWSAVGCLLWVQISDCFGFKLSYCILLVLQFIVASMAPDVRSDSGMYMIWILVSFVFNGAHQPPVYMSYCCDLYGSRAGGILSGVIFLVTALGNLLNWSLTVYFSGKLMYKYSNDYHFFYRPTNFRDSTSDDCGQLIARLTFKQPKILQS